MICKASKSSIAVRRFSRAARSFHPSEIVESLTWFLITPIEEAAYDAPFPSREYTAGVRVFPSLLNQHPGLNEDAWEDLKNFEKLFLTIWAANDPGGLGACATQQNLIDNIPGAAGLPHTRLDKASHFLQDDQGEEIANRLVKYFAYDPEQMLGRGDRYCGILLVDRKGLSLEAEVWGTPGLNDCPVESWEALDANVIKDETGALSVIMNGPRYWIPNSVTGSLQSPTQRTFGDIEMRLLASLEVDPTQSNDPYLDRIIGK